MGRKAPLLGAMAEGKRRSELEVVLLLPCPRLAVSLVVGSSDWIHK